MVTEIINKKETVGKSTTVQLAAIADTAAATSSLPKKEVVVKTPVSTDDTNAVLGGIVITNTTAPVGAPQAPAVPIVARSAPSIVVAGLEQFSADGKELIATVLNGGSTIAKSAILDLLAYGKAMAPNTLIPDVVGGANQIALYRSLQNCVNNADRDFPLMMATILRIVFELSEKGAFQGFRPYRFFESMNMNQQDRDGFQALLHVLVTLSDLSMRSVAKKQVDLNGKNLSRCFTAQGHQRFVNFFN